ncbi:Protein yippee-like, partial [Capsicum chinense]
MENISVVNLEGKIYSCKQCGTHIALSEDIISKSFHGRNGKSYFVNNVKLPMKKVKNSEKENGCLICE